MRCFLARKLGASQFGSPFGSRFARFQSGDKSRAPKRSGPARDGVTLFPKVLGEIFLHLYRRIVRHRIKVLVELRQQPNTVFFNHPSCFVPVLVIFKTVLHRKPRQPDINTRLPGVAPRIETED